MSKPSFLLKSLLTITLIAALFLLGCERDFTEAPVSNDRTAVFNDSQINRKGYISGDEIPHIVSKLNQDLQNFSFSKMTSAKGFSREDVVIDLQEIIEKKNGAGMPTNYSFAIYKANAPVNEFYNLVIGEYSDGSTTEPHIRRYVMDDEAVDSYIRSGGSTKDFQGMVYLESLENFFGDEGFSFKGSADECPIDGEGFYIFPPAEPTQTYNPGQSYTTSGGSSGGLAGMYAVTSVGAATFTGATVYNFSMSITTVNPSTGENIRETVTTAATINSAGTITTNVYSASGYLISTINVNIPAPGTNVSANNNNGGETVNLCTNLVEVRDSEGNLVTFRIETVPCDPNQQKQTYQSKDCIYFNQGEVGINSDTMTNKLNFKLQFPTSSTEYTWMQNNIIPTYLIFRYLSDNGPNDPEVIGFAKEAVTTHSEGGQSELLYELLIDDEFLNNPCLMGAFISMGSAPEIDQYLKNFEQSGSVGHLQLSASTTLDPTINAITHSPSNYVINITFNSNNLDRPALSVARTLIHELIHAEMYRKLLSEANQGSIPWSVGFINSIRNDFPGLYDYYMRWKYNRPEGIPGSDDQHELMAQHYRGIISQALQDIDNTQTNEVYDALAWAGLMGHCENFDANYLCPDSPQAWRNLTSTQRQQIINTMNSFNQSNTNCQ